jgi:hypothetical protein
MMLARLAAASAVVGAILGAAITWKALPDSHAVQVASAQKTYDRPRFVETRGSGTTLERVKFESGSNPVLIQWYDGAWMPVAPSTGSYAELVVDRRKVAASLLGGLTGEDEARPGWLDWTGKLGSGTHQAEIRVYRADARFAFPFSEPGRRVPDSLFVSELGG